MKKVVIALVIIIIAGVLGVGAYYFFDTGTEAAVSTQEESTDIDSSSSVGSDSSAVGIYVDAVNSIKNKTDFNLDVTTSFYIIDVSTSLSIFDSMIESFIGSDDFEPETVSYSFVEGVDSATSETPDSVIQPANQSLENIDLNAVLVSNVTENGESEDVSISIMPEELSFSTLMNSAGDGEGDMDFSQIAPYHSQFVDIYTVISSMGSMFSFAEDESGDSAEASDETEEFAESMQDGDSSFDFSDSSITLGSSSISANINSESLPSEIDMTIPLTMQATLSIMNSDVTVEFQIEISQEYVFSYE